jgi:hypothetical protein
MAARGTASGHASRHHRLGQVGVVAQPTCLLNMPIWLKALYPPSPCAHMLYASSPQCSHMLCCLLVKSCWHPNPEQRPTATTMPQLLEGFAVCGGTSSPRIDFDEEEESCDWVVVRICRWLPRDMLNLLLSPWYVRCRPKPTCWHSDSKLTLAGLVMLLGWLELVSTV